MEKPKPGDPKETSNFSSLQRSRNSIAGKLNFSIHSTPVWPFDPRRLWHREVRPGQVKIRPFWVKNQPKTSLVWTKFVFFGSPKLDLKILKVKFTPKQTARGSFSGRPFGSACNGNGQKVESLTAEELIEAYHAGTSQISGFFLDMSTGE